MFKSAKLGGVDRTPEVNTVDSKKNSAVQGIKQKLLEALESQGAQGNTLKLAAIAGFVEEYLAQTHENQDTQKPTKKTKRIRGNSGKLSSTAPQRTRR